MEKQEEKENEQEQKQYQENVVAKILLDSMNDNEKETARFDVYRVSKIPDSKIKKLVQQNFGSVSLNEFSTVVMRTVAKVYAGELIEEAKIYMNEKNHKGPIQPYHLAEAKRRLQIQNKDLSHQQLSNIFN